LHYPDKPDEQRAMQCHRFLEKLEEKQKSKKKNNDHNCAMDASI
jgi:hypothetical protein